MKRFLLCVLALVVLTGCRQQDEWSKVLQIREQLLQSKGCTFDAGVTADYGQIVYNFTLHCTANQNGAVSFEVLLPQSIAGITGTVSAEGGKLTFDDQVLAFSLLAEGRLSPVAAPWIIVNTLRSGYIKAYSHDGEGMCIEINDSYEEDALQLMIRTDGAGIPCGAEIYWQGTRLLTVQIENFSYL